jgi:hypothetical protein
VVCIALVSELKLENTLQAYTDVPFGHSVPDPDPYDQYVFGPLGSGSVIICTDPDPSINKRKIRDKP